MWKMRRKFHAVLAAVVLFTSINFCPVKAEAANLWEPVSGADWMANIDGNLKITQINMPGTHDSGTQKISLATYSQCQDKSIEEQLNMGIRFLDIRLEAEDSGKLYLVHGSTDCQSNSGGKLYLEEVLTNCYQFLDAHPTETIVMSMKKDDGDQDDSVIQQYIHQNYIDKNSNYWYLQNGKPVLNDARGKIVLARRYYDKNNYGDAKGGLNFLWGDQGGNTVAETPWVRVAVTGLTGLWIQDRYEYSTGDKWTAVQQGLDSPPDENNRANVYFLNFLSAAPKKSIIGIESPTSPKDNAKEINPKFLSYEMTQGKAYGWIIFDFATEELAKKVIASNPYTSRLTLPLNTAKAAYNQAVVSNAYTKDSLDTFAESIAAAQALADQENSGTAITTTQYEETVTALTTAADNLAPKSLKEMEEYLLGFYPLTKDGNDTSKNNNHATAKGVTFSRENGVQIKGDGKLQSYLSLPTKMFDGKDQLTISFWAQDNGSSATRNQSVFSFGSGTDSNPNTSNVYKYVLINTSNNNYLKAVITDNSWSNETGFKNTEASYPKQTWAHITCVFNGTQFTLYKDGKLVGTKDTGIKPTAFGTNTVAYIGNSIWGNSDNDYIGCVKDFRVYHASLTSSQVAEIYNYKETLPVEYVKQDLIDSLTEELGMGSAAEENGHILLDVSKGSLTLPTTGYQDASISWTSSHPDIIDVNTGKVTQPAAGSTATEVILTATVTLPSGQSAQILFSCSVNPIQTYTISFDAANGSAITTTTVTKGEKVAEPEAPLKDGYTFAGWFAEGSDTAFNFNTAIISNLTLTAKWTENQKPTDPTDPSDPSKPTDPSDPSKPTDPEECEHNYKEVVKKATEKENGSITKQCTKCQAIEGEPTVIYAAEKIELSETSYVCDGSVKKPTVTIKDSQANTLQEQRDYTISYPEHAKDEGTYTVTITFSGNYTGTVERTFTILPEDKGGSQGDYTYRKLEDGSLEITKYDGNDTELVIPEKLDGIIVTKIGEHAFSNCKILTGVIIPESVVSIGAGAFSGCNNLVKIAIPESVASIEADAFMDCSKELTLQVAPGSYGESYAKENNVNHNAPTACEHNYTTQTTEPTCTTAGEKVSICTKCGDIENREVIPAAGHKEVMDPGIEATCTEEGKTEGSHCEVCQEVLTEQEVIPAAGHDYKKEIIKATTTKNGSIVEECTNCGEKQNKTTVYAVKTVKLSKTSYIYNGKNQKPSITVKDSKGKILNKQQDYTISYSKTVKNVGIYTVKINLKGNYKGTVTKTYTITPKSTSISKITSKKRGFVVTWKKQAKQITGYEVAYSPNAKFAKKNTTVLNVAKNKTTAKPKKALNAKKKYYLKIRTYKTIKQGGKTQKVYSKWSNTKSVTTKK